MTSVLTIEPPQTYTRKRTTSFSTPSASGSRPRKAPRTTMVGLQRSQSCLSLPTLATLPSCTACDDTPVIRTLQYFKDRREKRQAATSLSVSSTKPPAIVTEPIRTTRLSSPLSPSPHPISLSPCCPIPRKKAKNVEPDLYRIAITTAMKSSPEGQQILKFGARGAVAATFDLEMMVMRGRRKVRDIEGDVIMRNETTSWVLV